MLTDDLKNLTLGEALARCGRSGADPRIVAECHGRALRQSVQIERTPGRRRGAR